MGLRVFVDKSNPMQLRQQASQARLTANALNEA
jgi:hypothetical protein